VGLAFGPDGNLYVADTDNVVKFNGTTGAFISIFVASGSGALLRPDIPLFGDDGNLYVGTENNGTLLYNGTTGAFITQFVSGIGSKLGALAFGPDGNFYVDYVPDSLLRYNGQTGALIGTFIPPGDVGIIEGMVFTPGSTVPLAIQPSNGGRRFSYGPNHW
jgi:outer membrane protein assembly factor BamB